MFGFYGGAGRSMRRSMRPLRTSASSSRSGRFDVATNSTPDGNCAPVEDRAQLEHSLHLFGELSFFRGFAFPGIVRRAAIPSMSSMSKDTAPFMCQLESAADTRRSNSTNMLATSLAGSAI